MPADVSYEDTKRCPKCGKPGQPLAKTPGPHGSKIHQFRCDNQLCRWQGTGWIVQVNEDGTIADRNDERITVPKKPRIPRILDSDMEKYRQKIRDERKRSQSG